MSRVESQCGKQVVQFLDIRNAIQSGQIAQQYLIDDITFDEALHVRLDLRREQDFRVTSVVQVAKEFVIQRPEVCDLKFIEGHKVVCKTNFCSTADQPAVVQQAELLAKGQRRQQELREATRARLLAFQSQGGRGRARDDQFEFGTLIYQHFQMPLPFAQVLHLVEEQVRGFIPVPLRGARHE